jgi:YD repeat-containing protein
MKINVLKFKIFILFFLTYKLNAQEHIISVPTPNAANLGIFNQIPASLFTGVPNISIPLYNVTIGYLELPISLSYHISQVKPDIQPGWVGLGWNLNCGGSITRISRGNGLYDENSFSDATYSYYNVHSELSDQNWCSDVFIKNLLNNPFNLAKDYEPDEFIFNFGKYSGSFYLNHDGRWIVQTNSPVDIKVVASLNHQSLISTFGIGNSTNQFTIQRYYLSFSLKTEDGIEYFFGNDVSEVPNSYSDPAAIEFSVDVSKKASNFVNELIPTTWHLTKIIHPNGDTIKIKYKRGDAIYHLTKFIGSSKSNLSFSYTTINFWNSILFGWFLATDFNYNTSASYFEIGYKENLLFPSFIDEIKTSKKNVSLKFNILDANQLGYNLDIINNNIFSSVELTPSPLPNNTKTKKLNSIKIYDKNDILIKQIIFNYLDEPTKRLFLNSLFIYGQSNNEKMSYEFTYNTSINLPNYNSGKVDHWGFYKGDPDYFSNPANIETIRTITEENKNYMQAGILTKIKYPTGGFTEFYYEPNYYSSIVKRQIYPSPPLCELIGANKITGGLRIKKIKFVDSNGVTVSQKEYYYIKNYLNGGTLSSGILAGEPKYVEAWNNLSFDYYESHGKESFYSFSDRIVEPLSYTNGSHITYSEVVERETGNGYKIYKYANSDNPNYIDQPAYYSITNNCSQRYLPFNSKDYLRGCLLSESFYNENKTLQKEIIYSYRIENPSSDDEEIVRALHLRLFSIFNIPTAYAEYSFCPYLLNKIINEYDVNGENPVTTLESFNYNYNNLIKEYSINLSNGLTTIQKTFYPPDYPSATNFTRSMRDAHIINKPVEQYTTVNGNVTQGVLNTYKTGADLGLNDITYRLEASAPLTSGQFSPSNYNGGFSIYSYYKPDIIYDKYDKGNLVQYHKANDINVSYIWGYNNTYPIAEARNAAVNQIAYTSFEDGCPSGWTCSGGGFLEHIGTNTGTKVFSAYSWSLQSPTLPAGTYIVSFWAKGATSYSAATIKINGGNSINPDDNTGGYYQKTITLSSSGKITLSAGYISIDEVRIYPSNAMMKTYTYNPLVGMTSATDENGKTTYYEYDGFGRLQYIRNQDREIIQEYKYHYKE